MKNITLPFILWLFLIFVLICQAVLLSYLYSTAKSLKADFAEQKVYYEETIKRLEAENQKLKNSQLIVPKIVASIAWRETHQGKAGVGRKHCNNPTGIAGKCFSSLLEGYRYSVDLWQRKYAHLPIRTALKTWKVGNQPWTPEVDAYIQDILSKA